MTDEPRWMTRETMKQESSASQREPELLSEAGSNGEKADGAREDQIKDQLVREYNNGQAAGRTAQRERDALMIEERLADITLSFGTRIILWKLADKIMGVPDGHLEACDCPQCNARRQATREKIMSVPRMTVPRGVFGISGGAPIDPNARGGFLEKSSPPEAYTVMSQETRRGPAKPKQMKSASVPGCTCMLCEEDRKAGR